MTDFNVADITCQLIGSVGASLIVDYAGSRASESDKQSQLLLLQGLDISYNTYIANILYQQVIKHKLLNYKILMPRDLVLPNVLPNEILTNDNVGKIRNSDIKDGLTVITACGSDRLSDTMANAVSVQANDFLSEESAEFWANASYELALRKEHNFKFSDDDRCNFAIALRAFMGAPEGFNSINNLASFCISVLRASMPVLEERMGCALPVIMLPRDIHGFDFESTAKKNPEKKKRDYLRKVFNNMNERRKLFRRLDLSGKEIDREEFIKRINTNEESLQNIKDAAFKYINSTEIKDAIELFHYDWVEDNVKSLFEKEKKVKEKLARQTIEFFELNASSYGSSEELTDEDHEVISHIDDPQKTIDNDPDIKNPLRKFFDVHSEFMLSTPEGKKIYRQWEKILFERSVVCEDFLIGLCEIFSNFPASEPGRKRFVEIKLKSSIHSLTSVLNYKVGCFFSIICRFFKDELSDQIHWITKEKEDNPSPIFNFTKFYENRAKKSGLKKSTSVSKEALSLKFDIVLNSTNIANEDLRPEYEGQLIWNFKKDAVGLTLDQDLERLIKSKKLCVSKAYRRMTSSKGGIRNVSLSDISTLQDSGSGFIKKSTETDYGKIFLERLKSNRIDPEITSEIETQFHVFKNAYFESLDDIADHGVKFNKAQSAACEYASLLGLIRSKILSPDSKKQLMEPLLKFGTILIDDDYDDRLIIAPWHPERLKAIALRQNRVIGFLDQCLKGIINSGNHELPLAAMEEDLKHVIAPEVTISPQIEKLLSASENVNGYVLYEPINRSDVSTLSDQDPEYASMQIYNFLLNFLKMYPHLNNGINVLLYECNMTVLPEMLLNRLLNDPETVDRNISIFIYNTEQDIAAKIYRSLSLHLDMNKSQLVTSAASDGFISNLQVTVLNSLETGAGRKFDICIMYDVFSRLAILGWETSEDIKIINDKEYTPARVSYRNVQTKDSYFTSTYIACPQQTLTSSEYIRSLYCLLEGRVSEKLFLPSLTLQLKNENINTYIDQPHKVADCVVNYDAFLTKKQLEMNNIEVVHYKKENFNGRNVIISSRDSYLFADSLLREMLRGIHGLFKPGSSSEEKACVIKQCSQQIRDESKSISGSILLRAAHSSVFTGEMIGLVLSKYFIDSTASFKLARFHGGITAFFMLDDYAEWFTNSSDQSIADILAMAINMVDGRLNLSLKIVESKFVSSACDEQARKSRQQLINTLKTFKSGLCGALGEDVQQICLNRLAEMLLDSEQYNTELLLKARTLIRAGECDVFLSGASLVFDYNYQDTVPYKKIINEIYNSLRIEDVEYINNQQVIFPADVTAKLLRELIFDKGHCNAFDTCKSEIGLSDIDGVLTDYRKLPIEFPKSENLSRDVNELSDPESDIHHKSKTQDQTTANVYSLDREVVNQQGAKVPVFVRRKFNITDSSKKESDKLQTNTQSSCEDILDNINNTSQSKNMIQQTDRESSDTSLISYKTIDDIQIQNDAINEQKSFLINDDIFHQKMMAFCERNLRTSVVHEDDSCVAELESTHDFLEKYFKAVGIGAHVVEEYPGPKVLTFYVQPEPGVASKKIINEYQEIRFQTGGHTTMVMNPESKPVVAFVIPRKKPETVYFKDVVDSRAFVYSDKILPVCLGKDTRGEPQVFDLSTADHVLIAGSSGSGKSSAVNSFISSLLLKCTPKRLRMLMIDPKGTEFNRYQNLPHLIAPVIMGSALECVQNATRALDWCNQEMDRRNALFQKYYVPDLTSYNQMIEALLQQGNPVYDENGHECLPLPYIAIFIEEYVAFVTDMDKPDREVFTSYMKTLLSKSRSAGMCFVVITQSPKADTLPSDIRNNFNTRIALRLTDQRFSNMIIDADYATDLTGKGEFFILEKDASLRRMQSAYVSHQEVLKLIDYERKLLGEPNYCLTFYDVSDSETEDGTSDAQLMRDIYRYLDDVGSVSIADLEREFSLTHSKATMIHNQLFKEGLIKF